jgi:hypothetical protein
MPHCVMITLVSSFIGHTHAMEEDSDDEHRSVASSSEGKYKLARPSSSDEHKSELYSPNEYEENQP